MRATHLRFGWHVDLWDRGPDKNAALRLCGRVAILERSSEMYLKRPLEMVRSEDRIYVCLVVMNEEFFTELSAWLTEAGLAGTSETAIVSGFCDRCVAAGLPLARSLLFIDTLHPVPVSGHSSRGRRAGICRRVARDAEPFANSPPSHFKDNFARKTFGAPVEVHFTL